ncbi:MAG: hypothetical protein AAF358_04645 [Pseudomonadota bacterium]
MKKSADITDQITEQVSDEIRHLLERYFFESLEAMELTLAVASGGRRTVGFRFAGPSGELGVDTEVHVLVYSIDDAPWEVSEINLYGEYLLPGENDPISFVGAFTPESLGEVVDHSRRFWSKTGGGEIKIEQVATNRLPPLRSLPAYLEGKSPRDVYSVSASSVEPPPLPEVAHNTAMIGISGGSSLTLRLERAIDDSLAVTDANAGIYPNPNPSLLRLIQANLERPLNQKETTERMTAARAVLPERLREADVDLGWILLRGQWDQLFCHVEADQDPGKFVIHQLHCSRLAGTDEPWRCGYLEIPRDFGIPNSR